MQLNNKELLLLFTFSFMVVSALTPLMRNVALRFGVIDSPNASHKTHKKPVPYLGGVAIVLGVVIISYFAIFVSGVDSNSFGLANTVLIPAILMGLIGLIDDIKNLSPWPRFVAQNIVGIISSAILIVTKTIGSPTGSNLLDIAITLVWIVGLTNAVNFLDNIDGGASGVMAISAFFLFVVAYQGGQILIAAFSLTLAGGTLGFLFWNRPPARIYMGDAGALFLGLLVASLSVRLEPNPINRGASFAIPILLLAVPILDTSVAVTSRLARGISPFQGGKDHLSHRLIRIGLSKRQAVVVIWLVTGFFGAFAFVISNSSYALEGALTLLAAFCWSSLLLYFLSIESE